MATRRRTLLLSCALVFGAVVLPASVVAASPVQDPGATFGGGGVETTTTVPAATTTTESNATNQTLVESEETPDQPLFTENRKVAAVIGGLVLVALALLLLTVRYIRVTKPVAHEIDDELPLLPSNLQLDEESVFVVAEPEAPTSSEEVADEAPLWTPPPAPAAAAVSPLAAASGTDHDAADDDWEPRTGEHERVEIPSGATMARPGVAARRKALGVDAS